MAAETKRHSIGGKGPSGPVPSGFGPSGTVNLETALSGAVGSRVRIITAAPTAMTLEGTLFTACPITNLVAINTSPLPPTPITPGTPALSTPSDFHIIPISRIQHFQLISLPPHNASTTSEPPAPFTNAYPTIYPLDIRALKSREAAAVARLQEREQRRGKGVTKEAQDLFDAFSRTMPARWDGTSMIIADTVVIAKPYRVEDCRSVAPEEGGANAALTRVRKVLEMERKKIELRNASAAIHASKFPRAQNHTSFDANATANSNNAASNVGTNASTPIPKDRDRDSKVALPISAQNAVRSPPPGGAASNSQRKGG
ncbi:hypothetical protein VTO42DRAFT_273 [Malbranchea cinnamomea]